MGPTREAHIFVKCVELNNFLLIFFVCVEPVGIIEYILNQLNK